MPNTHHHTHLLLVEMRAHELFAYPVLNQNPSNLNFLARIKGMNNYTQQHAAFITTAM
jgi:hypothetical protein